MKNQSQLLKIAFLVILSTFLTLPAHAISTQKILNQNLKDLNLQQGYNIFGEMNLIKLKTSKKNANTKTKLKIQINHNLNKIQDNNQNFIGNFIVKEFSFHNFNQNITYNLPKPISIDYRKINESTYFKINKLNPVLENLLDKLEIKDNFTQQWFQFNNQQITQKISNQYKINDNFQKLLASENKQIETQKIIDTILKKQIFKTTRIEKVYHNQKGEKIIRARININSQLLYKEYISKLRQAYKIKKRSDRYKAIKKLRNEYQDIKKSLKKFHFAGNFNTTTKKIERLEFAFHEKKPLQDCKYDLKTYKKTCHKDGYETIIITGGFWIKASQNPKILIPYGSIELDSSSL